MKTLMITKGSWQEVRKKCIADPEYTFIAEQLEQDCETIATRNAAVGVISSMRAMDLLDDQGKLTAMGRKWANENTYPEACKELAETHFPQVTRDAIKQGEASVGDIVAEYSKIEGMNEAGGRKNVRILTMLMKDANDIPVLKQGPTKGTRSKGDQDEQTPSLRKEQKSTLQKKQKQAELSAKAQIEMTIPLEKLSDVMLAVFSKVSPDEVSTDVRFI